MKFLKLALLLAFAAWLAAPSYAMANDESGAGTKRHPTYNLMGRDNAPSADSPLNPNFVLDEGMTRVISEVGFWRSAYMNESLVGMVVADIDGDGQNEVVYASSRNIYVTRFGGGKLGQMAAYNSVASISIVSVDALDLTGDGQMEIIASAQDDKNAPVSMILSFNGDSLTPLTTNIPWYLRVIGGPGGQFLAGQKAATDRVNVFSGKVMRMKYDGKKVSSQGAVGLPPFVNLFGFTLGRLGTGGIQMVAAIKFPTEHLFLFEGSGQDRAWESKEEYGGTMTFLAPTNVSSDGGKNRVFLPSRLLIADIDGDGQNELIVAKNDRGGIPFMSGQRGFTSGIMQAFKYSNMSLVPFFRSRTLPGPAVDYALADFNNDGSMDLVVAVVTEQKSGILQEGRSVIVAYEIGAREPAKQEETRKKK